MKILVAHVRARARAELSVPVGLARPSRSSFFFPGNDSVIVRALYRGLSRRGKRVSIFR